jgi:hypothetical protein
MKVLVKISSCILVVIYSPSILSMMRQASEKMTISIRSLHSTEMTVLHELQDLGRAKELPSLSRH